MIKERKPLNLWRCLLMMLFAAGLFLSGLSLSAAAADTPVFLSRQVLETFFDAALQEQMRSGHLVGAAVAVIRADQAAFTKGYGYADHRSADPVHPGQTLFFTGSDGKLLLWGSPGLTASCLG